MAAYDSLAMLGPPWPDIPTAGSVLGREEDGGGHRTQNPGDRLSSARGGNVLRRAALRSPPTETGGPPAEAGYQGPGATGLPRHLGTSRVGRQAHPGRPYSRPWLLSKARHDLRGRGVPRAREEFRGNH